MTLVSVWSLLCDRYDSALLSMACCLLDPDLAFVISLSVLASIVRHSLWYWTSSAGISSSAYSVNNPGFWSGVAISCSLVSDWILLAVDTLPSNLSQKKHVFNGAIDVANLDCVLHWLTHSYVSLCVRLRTVFSFIPQVFAMMFNGSLVQSQCLHRHLVILLVCVNVHRSGGDFKNPLDILVKLWYPEPEVYTLPLAGHRHLIFLTWPMTQHSNLIGVFTTSVLLFDGSENTWMTEWYEILPNAMNAD